MAHDEQACEICREFIADAEKRRSDRRLPIGEFDDLARAGGFEEGPFVSNFGDGYGEPYMPVRIVCGTLKGGEEVWAVKHYGAK